MVTRHRYVLAISGAMADGLCSLDAGGDGCAAGKEEAGEVQWRSLGGAEPVDEDAGPADEDDQYLSYEGGEEQEEGGELAWEDEDEAEDAEAEEDGRHPGALLGHVGFGWGAPAVICRGSEVTAGDSGGSGPISSMRRTGSTGQLSTR